jgi:hypothetical protein
MKLVYKIMMNVFNPDHQTNLNQVTISGSTPAQAAISAALSSQHIQRRQQSRDRCCCCCYCPPILIEHGHRSLEMTLLTDR